MPRELLATGAALGGISGGVGPWTVSLVTMLTQSLSRTSRNKDAFS